jgi:hypothetical protein
MNVSAKFENCLCYILQKERYFVFITKSKSNLITIFTWYHFLNEELTEWIFKVTQSNELSNHAQKRLHRFREHLS